MIRRYTLPEMGAIWTDAGALRAHAPGRARGRPGPGRAAASSRRTRSPPSRHARRVDVDRIAEIEQTTDHDVIAFVSQVAETVGPEGRYLHLGLTSSDVVDTGARAPAPRRRRAAPARTATGSSTRSSRRARAEADTVMMGRTHSRPRRADDVRAEARRLGVRGRPRPAPPRRRPSTRSGPARSRGRSARTATSSPDIEAEVLGAARSPRRSRRAPRSCSATATRRSSRRSRSSAGRLERFATEIRNLQHTEIGEVMEPFRAGQKGCSAMPHKRNPILSRADRGPGPAAARLRPGRRSRTSPCGTSATSATRSAERVILPDATILLDYMLVRVHRRSSTASSCAAERMRENIERGLGLHASSRVLDRARGAAAASRARTPTRSSSAPRSGPPTSAGRCASSWRSIRPSRSAAAGRPSTPASTTRPPSATCRRSSPDSTAPGGDAQPCRWLSSLSVRPLRQGPRPLPRSATGACSSSPRTASPRSTWSCPPRSRTRAASSPACPASGSPRRAGSCRTTSSPRTRWPCRRAPPRGGRAADSARDDDRTAAEELRGRMMLCRELEVLPVEVVVRGYLSGSAWKAYQKDGSVCGVALPAGLRESDRLPEPILTPSTKAEIGAHDENIDVRGDGRPAGRRSRRPRAGRPHPRYRARGSTATAPRSPSGRASSWPTRSSSSAWSRDRATSSWPTRCSPRTRPASGTRSRGSRAAPRRRSTSSSCATGSIAQAVGQDGARAGPPGRGRRPGPATATSPRSSASPGPASPGTSRRTSSPDE